MREFKFKYIYRKIITKWLRVIPARLIAMFLLIKHQKIWTSPIGAAKSPLTNLKAVGCKSPAREKVFQAVISLPSAKVMLRRRNILDLRVSPWSKRRALCLKRPNSTKNWFLTITRVKCQCSSLASLFQVRVSRLIMRLASPSIWSRKKSPLSRASIKRICRPSQARPPSSHPLIRQKMRASCLLKTDQASQISLTRRATIISAVLTTLPSAFHLRLQALSASSPSRMRAWPREAT